MILFDFGGTLARETENDFLRGWQGVFRAVKDPPAGASPARAHELASRLWEYQAVCRRHGAELHEWQQLRTVLGVLGLEEALDLETAERLLMENASAAQPVPYAGELLSFLHRQGIRTGVVSNIGWSGNGLAHRLKQILPENRFEFVIASSEYGIRKPDPLLFQAALKKAGLPASQVWYCGDDLQADIAGAHGAGLFPVWFGGRGPGPDFPHLRVGDWRELAELLEKTVEEGERC
ncbi:MAG: HAD family hydrolase [Acutalibacter sp.]|nr:HAD family hydrolase [Acutalibacter sp.]